MWRLDCDWSFSVCREVLVLMLTRRVSGGGGREDFTVRTRSGIDIGKLGRVKLAFRARMRSISLRLFRVSDHYHHEHLAN